MVNHSVDYLEQRLHIATESTCFEVGLDAYDKWNNDVLI